MEHQDSHTREETGAGLVAPGYFDYQGRWQDVPWEQRRALFAAMGVRGDSEADVQRDLAAREDDQWRRWLPPVCVRVRSAASIDIPITLPAKESERDYAWRVTLENGERLEGRCRPAQLRTVAERSVGGDLHRQFALTLPDRIPLGYHRVELRSGPRSEASQLIVAPERCFEPPAVAADRRVWGFAVQLYALRSSRNWGIGDLSDLRELMDIAAEAGAGLVGISPVHALFIRNPHSASPYNPSSRLFGNVLLLDVEAIPDYVASEAAPDLADQEFRDRLESLRRGELIDYAGVAAVKMPAFEAAFRRFQEYELAGGSLRGRQFRSFQAEQGERLRLHCLFEALQERFHRESPEIWGWPVWPEPYRDPASPAVRRFASAHVDRLDFHAYLQWQFELQLEAVAVQARSRGLGIGLYRDLAVGVDSGGAETWSAQSLYALTARVGAPPDMYNLKGQNWGLPPLDPVALRAAGYGPFIDTLRANMKHAGALRIDHAMALTRLYWIPLDGSPRHGAYVNYPLDDLLSIVALESVRNRCLVVGEDLGTVPAQFSDALRARGVLSYRLLYFETADDGSFRPPPDWR